MQTAHSLLWLLVFLAQSTLSVHRIRFRWWVHAQLSQTHVCTKYLLPSSEVRPVHCSAEEYCFHSGRCGTYTVLFPLTDRHRDRLVTRSDQEFPKQAKYSSGKILNVGLSLSLLPQSCGLTAVVRQHRPAYRPPV